MSSSAHIDNKKKDILILGKGPAQRLEHTLSAEQMYSINFTATKKKFCLSLHQNGANSCLFVNCTEIYKSKAKESEIVATPLCLGNISKDWSNDNMKKQGLMDVYDFRVDYDATDLNDIIDVHKYLMKKNNSVNENIWICQKIVFHRINNFIRFHKRKFVECISIELYFSE